MARLVWPRSCNDSVQIPKSLMAPTLISIMLLHLNEHQHGHYRYKTKHHYVHSLTCANHWSTADSNNNDDTHTRLYLICHIRVFEPCYIRSKSFHRYNFKKSFNSTEQHESTWHKPSENWQEQQRAQCFIRCATWSFRAAYDYQPTHWMPQSASCFHSQYSFFFYCSLHALLLWCFDTARCHVKNLFSKFPRISPARWGGEMPATTNEYKKVAGYTTVDSHTRAEKYQFTRKISCNSEQSAISRHR